MRQPVTFTRVSLFSGKAHDMEIVLDMQDYVIWTSGGGNIQNVLHYLTPDEREFLMTGITPTEWAKAFDK